MSTSQGSLLFLPITLMLVVHYGSWSHNGQGIPTVKKPKEQHSEVCPHISYRSSAVASFFHYYFLNFFLQCINCCSFCKSRKSFTRQHFRNTLENQHETSDGPCDVLRGTLAGLSAAPQHQYMHSSAPGRGVWFWLSLCRGFN